MPSGSSSSASRPGFRDVLGMGEFRALFVAHLLSLIGDQVAKVALAILVFDRTSSSALAASTYALTYLPWLVGTPLLSGLGDRHSRRSVMVVCDLLRAAVVGLLVIPGLPIWLVLAVLGAVTFLAPPFESARAALLADVLAGDRYVFGSALTQMSVQGGQVAGFAAGGALVAVFTPRGALLLDAATFAVSAVLLLGNIRSRPATAATEGTLGPYGQLRAWLDGLRHVASRPMLRSLVLLAWVTSVFSIVTEGLAVAIVRGAGRGDAAVGLLTAAQPVGALVGSVVIARWVQPQRRISLLLPLAFLNVMPLAFSTVAPGLAALFALWVAAGFGGSFNLAASALFVQAVPAELRARAFGVAQAGLQIVQGLALLMAGEAAEWLGPLDVVTLAGVLGVFGVGVLCLRWPRVLRD